MGMQKVASVCFPRSWHRAHSFNPPHASVPASSLESVQLTQGLWFHLLLYLWTKHGTWHAVLAQKSPVKGLVSH